MKNVEMKFLSGTKSSNILSFHANVFDDFFCCCVVHSTSRHRVMCEARCHGGRTRDDEKFPQLFFARPSTLLAQQQRMQVDNSNRHSTHHFRFNTSNFCYHAVWNKRKPKENEDRQGDFLIFQIRSALSQPLEHLQRGIQEIFTLNFNFTLACFILFSPNFHQDLERIQNQ